MTTRWNNVIIQPMQIIFTKHAKARMSEREITEKEIKSAIENPDIIKESFRERNTARRKFPQGTLEVIYKEAAGKFIIITGYWAKEG